MAYHFIGLGGIGMSALARILLDQGNPVQGSDAKESSTLEELEKRGAKVEIGHNKESIASATTVVYSTCITKDNVELEEAKRLKKKILHRSDLLRELMEGKKSLFVAGTHGKTTTSSLLAHVLDVAKLDPSFALGGLIRSLNTNGRSGTGAYFVAEADESDGSFLNGEAYASILTNLTDDHLDYWGTSENLNRAFQKFINQSNALFWCYDDERLQKLETKGVSYGFEEGADWFITKYRQEHKGIVFNLNEHQNIQLALYGRHNALNGAAVFALARYLHIPEEVIREAFLTFSGACRRLEFKGERGAVQCFDDYGHHPREIQTTIDALRGRVGERRLICLFQPHRYSRVKHHFDAFVASFDEVDQLFVTDIYAAGEAPIDGISSLSLTEALNKRLRGKAQYIPREELVEGVSKKLLPHDVFLTLGAGDVTNAGIPILASYEKRGVKLKVGVLFGGTSAEHPVSEMSAKKIVDALNPTLYDVQVFGITKEGMWGRGFEIQTEEEKLPPSIVSALVSCDACIPVFHGPQGEDGMVGAVLDALNIPYAGCDYRSSAVCMQKAWSKQIAQQHNVPIVPYLEVKKNGVDLDRIERQLTYPIWVKPAHLGSSIGVYRAEGREELLECMAKAFQYDHVLILEEHIEGRQIEFGIMGNERLQKATPSEIDNSGAFVAFDKKYGSNAMPIKAPCELTETEREVGLELAETVYRALGCTGLARVDFFLEPGGIYWFNEINPFPGFTETSAFPIMWEQTGMSREQINDLLIILALHKSRRLGEVRGRQ